MQPIPAGHVRVAMVAAFDIPIPPPPYLKLDLELMTRWLRGVIELGLEHSDQDDVSLVAVRDAGAVLEDPDLVPFIGPARPIVSSVLRTMHGDDGSTPPNPEDAAQTWSPALRTMARRVAQERRKARLWQQKYEGLQKNVSWTQKRLANASVLADIERQEALIALDYRPGRTFPPGSPEPDCDRVISPNGVVWTREAIGHPPYGHWRARAPHGNDKTYSWTFLNSGDDAMTLTELLPLV